MKRKCIPFTTLVIVFSMLLTFQPACTSKPEDVGGETSTTSKPPRPPVVRDGTGHLLYSWFEDNDAKTTIHIKDIPDNVKNEVRVQNLSTPPEKRNPDWIFLANLTKKDANGNYSVRVVARDKYEEKRHPKAKAMDDKNVVGTTAPASVVMYATTHCPHCKRARRWLLEQKIPYREIDVEKDEAAAELLAQKGMEQGVPTSGVPMFEINGHLIPGFDPAAIQKAMNAPPRSPVTQPSLPMAPKGPTAPPSVPITPSAPSSMTI